MKIVIPGMGLLSDDEIELFEKTQHSIWGDTDDYDGPAAWLGLDPEVLRRMQEQMSRIRDNERRSERLLTDHKDSGQSVM